MAFNAMRQPLPFFIYQTQRRTVVPLLILPGYWIGLVIRPVALQPLNFGRVLITVY